MAEITSLAERASIVRRRMKECGMSPDDPLPINNGSRRTPEKRELLQAIQDNARAQGREPAFPANL